MPGLIVNTEEALALRQPLPPGEYHAILTGHKIQQPVTADKYPSIALEFTIHTDEGEEFAGKKAFRNLSASPKAAAFMVDAARALGAEDSEIVGPAVDFEEVFTALRGSECWLQTSIRTWQRNENSEPVEQTNVDNILGQAS